MSDADFLGADDYDDVAARMPDGGASGDFLDLDDGRPFSVSVEEFIALERPDVEALALDTDGRKLIGRNSLTLLGATGGHGKTTFFVEFALHAAAGVDYPPFVFPSPVSTLIVENEGAQEDFAEKLEAKLAAFDHELRARIGVHVLDWGAFSLADPDALARLVADVELHRYELVFGDPLDSLGIEGVGSPDDTRRFFALLKDAGLHRTAAFWINAHPRKEQTTEALNEIAGAWGGKPDQVFLLTRLADDRARLRFPKLRWAKRGTRPPVKLAFDADTESFEYVGEDVTEERRIAEDAEALDWIVEHVAATPGQPRGKVETAYVESRPASQKSGARARARRVIDAELHLAEQWRAEGADGENPARLAAGPGEKKHGTYLYPSNEAFSPLADPLFGENGENASEPPSSEPSRRSPPPYRKGGETARTARGLAERLPGEPD